MEPLGPISKKVTERLKPREASTIPIVDSNNAVFKPSTLAVASPIRLRFCIPLKNPSYSLTPPVTLPNGHIVLLKPRNPSGSTTLSNPSGNGCASKSQDSINDGVGIDINLQVFNINSELFKWDFHSIDLLSESFQFGILLC